ncbi:MAG: cob(I)yrinic acid a,c-diamide adenosyltransferase [Nanoarchaeota archaeon]
MKVYTKTGDKGTTSFFGCGIVKKNDPRVDVLGVIDELNSSIGVTLCFIEDEKLREQLNKIQNDLFTFGADLAGSGITADNLPRVNDKHVEDIELMIDELEEKLGMPQKFILPGGTVSSSFLHLCRATTRRAERALVNVHENNLKSNPVLLRYINRLGDFFFVLAREANRELDVKEQHPLYKYFPEKKTDNIESKEEMFK